MASGEVGEPKADSAVSGVQGGAGGRVPPWLLPFLRPGLAIHCPGIHEAQPQAPMPG